MLDDGGQGSFLTCAQLPYGQQRYTSWMTDKTARYDVKTQRMAYYSTAKTQRDSKTGNERIHPNNK